MVTTLYNRSEVQKAVKAKDGKTYWIGPKKHTNIPAPVDHKTLPKGVRLKTAVAAEIVSQPPNK